MSQQSGARRGIPYWLSILLILAAAVGGYALKDYRTPKGLLLRDFRPRNGLTVPVTQVDRARYPVIDVHQHMTFDNVAEEQVARMDSMNILSVCNMGRGKPLYGDNVTEYIEKYNNPFPGRLPTFCHIDFSKVNEPDFTQQAVASLEDNVKRGAVGLKVFKSLGIRFRDTDGNLYPVDHPKFDPIWAKAGELNIPVAIHSSDPLAFFQPVDRFNERYLSIADESTSRARAWAWYGQTDPYDHYDFLNQQENIVKKHPNTNFILIHCGMRYEHLEDLDKLLDTYPNANFDIAASAKHLGRQPHYSRKLLIKHQDRVVFGNDIYSWVDREIYTYFFRVLETDDDYFEHPEDHLRLPWKVYGLNLPDEVLKKIYYKNALRLIPALEKQLEQHGLIPQG